MAARMTLGVDPYLWEWGDLVFRWLHVIAAMAWVGASFYFIALDNHLRPPAGERDREEGVGGGAGRGRRPEGARRARPAEP